MISTGSSPESGTTITRSHFSEQAIPVQLDMLIGYTRQLKALSEKIASLTEELRKQWLPE